MSASGRSWAWVAALLGLALPTCGLACQCVASPADAALIARVQSSWAPAARWARAGQYARALRELRSTAALVPRIRDAGSRACVAAGADNLIASAAAGATYLARHPGAVAGARATARRAWHPFLACR